ncbi:MAG: cysteine--tRNA ligase [Marine Group III euryarchaeote CG-Bathy2]|uniref:Cysteine--tRNA ligase n=1 Tax=Marine Group III euryarchaeote CG-Bathy2 TaxID=1889002 RepID=A0A1J5T8G0_9ARCH|nr:MAG: cysteine--tRNA ligase [Marine Group III euryarchaeote CG-Bathy2]
MLKVYNSASRALEEFAPRDPGKVRMYVCGLTVYNDMHLGHARSYVAFDAIRRWLEHSGYAVEHVQNHTDIDDKIIARAAEEGVTPAELADRYIARTTADLAALGVRPPHQMPRATDYVEQMVALIADLLAKGHAYVAEPAEGALAPDVYFDVPSASEQFGTLTGQSLDELEAGARVAVDPRKRNPADFALWKGAREGEPSWESPWGAGRPGWHIECSAMSLTLLGPQFDIHGGGSDLKFPHHESEILQTECHTGKHPMVKYWMHTGFLTIDKEKMSKSLDNFFLVRDVLQHSSAEVVRFYLLNGHYRSPIDFSDAALDEAAAAHDRLAATLHRYRAASGAADAPSALRGAVATARADFGATMDDDFNTREALAALFGLAREANRHEPESLAPDLRDAVVAAFEELGGEVLGLFASRESAGPSDAEIEALLEQREAARAAKGWAEADRIRDELAEQGVEVQDTPDGARWRRT